MGRYPGRSANWPPAQAEKFQGMIRRLVARSLRIIMRPFNPGSNWGTSAMLGDMAAGVFLDDRTVYNQGRNALLRYMPGIIKKEGWCNETAEAGRHQNDLAIYQAKYDGQMDPRIGVGAALVRESAARHPGGGRCTRKRAGGTTRREARNTGRSRWPQLLHAHRSPDRAGGIQGLGLHSYTAFGAG